MRQDQGRWSIQPQYIAGVDGPKFDPPTARHGRQVSSAMRGERMRCIVEKCGRA